jgi:hypothetical protein
VELEGSSCTVRLTREHRGYRVFEKNQPVPLKDTIPATLYLRHKGGHRLR